ncbi:MAG: hypothetical protein KatS3mg027_0769 [Bacteroidia bacterium]|nr:MAG: hypothetical protein KatS3mg027_0769 [Bacteroidia bacterium]
MKTSIVISLIYLLIIPFTIKKSVNEEYVGIKFYEGKFKDALSLSKKENKLIFLDIYASWCGPCKKLKYKTFSNEEVGKFYNENFINLSLDGEEGEGAILAEKYGVYSYPTLLFLNSEGNVVYAVVGYHNPNEFIELGKKALKKYKK